MVFVPQFSAHKTHCTSFESKEAGKAFFFKKGNVDLLGLAKIFNSVFKVTDITQKMKLKDYSVI